MSIPHFQTPIGGAFLTPLGKTDETPQAAATTSVVQTDLSWNTDVVVRMLVNSAGVVTEPLWVHPTQALANQLTAWASAVEQDVQVLKHVTNWQKRRLDYQALYNAFLLGAISEEDFVSDAEQFVTEIRETQPEQIVSKYEQVSRLLDFELSVADFADFMDAEPEQVRKVLSMPHRHPIASGAQQVDVTSSPSGPASLR